MFTLGDVADILDTALNKGISIVDALAKLSDIADEGGLVDAKGYKFEPNVYDQNGNIISTGGCASDFKEYNEENISSNLPSDDSGVYSGSSTTFSMASESSVLLRSQIEHMEQELNYKSKPIPCVKKNHTNKNKSNDYQKGFSSPAITNADDVLKYEESEIGNGKLNCTAKLTPGSLNAKVSSMLDSFQKLDSTVEKLKIQALQHHLEKHPEDKDFLCTHPDTQTLTKKHNLCGKVKDSNSSHSNSDRKEKLEVVRSKNNIKTSSEYKNAVPSNNRSEMTGLIKSKSTFSKGIHSDPGTPVMHRSGKYKERPSTYTLAKDDGFVNIEDDHIKSLSKYHEKPVHIENVRPDVTRNGLDIPQFSQQLSQETYILDDDSEIMDFVEDFGDMTSKEHSSDVQNYSRKMSQETYILDDDLAYYSEMSSNANKLSSQLDSYANQSPRQTYTLMNSNHNHKESNTSHNNSIKTGYNHYQFSRSSKPKCKDNMKPNNDINGEKSDKKRTKSRSTYVLENSPIDQLHQHELENVTSSRANLNSVQAKETAMPVKHVIGGSDNKFNINNLNKIENLQHSNRTEIALHGQPKVEIEESIDMTSRQTYILFGPEHDGNIIPETKKGATNTRKTYTPDCSKDNSKDVDTIQDITSNFQRNNLRSTYILNSPNVDGLCGDKMTRNNSLIPTSLNREKGADIAQNDKNLPSNNTRRDQKKKKRNDINKSSTTKLMEANSSFFLQKEETSEKSSNRNKEMNINKEQLGLEDGIRTDGMVYFQIPLHPTHMSAENAVNKSKNNTRNLINKKNCDQFPFTNSDINETQEPYELMCEMTSSSNDPFLKVCKKSQRSKSLQPCESNQLQIRSTSGSLGSLHDDDIYGDKIQQCFLPLCREPSSSKEEKDSDIPKHVLFIKEKKSENLQLSSESDSLSYWQKMKSINDKNSTQMLLPKHHSFGIDDELDKCHRSENWKSKQVLDESINVTSNNDKSSIYSKSNISACQMSENTAKRSDLSYQTYTVNSMSSSMEMIPQPEKQEESMMHGLFSELLETDMKYSLQESEGDILPSDTLTCFSSSEVPSSEIFVSTPTSAEAPFLGSLGSEHSKDVLNNKLKTLQCLNNVDCQFQPGALASTASTIQNASPLMFSTPLAASVPKRKNLHANKCNISDNGYDTSDCTNFVLSADEISDTKESIMLHNQNDNHMQSTHNQKSSSEEDEEEEGEGDGEEEEVEVEIEEEEEEEIEEEEEEEIEEEEEGEIEEEEEEEIEEEEGEIEEEEEEEKEKEEGKEEEEEEKEVSCSLLELLNYVERLPTDEIESEEMLFLDDTDVYNGDEHDHVDILSYQEINMVHRNKDCPSETEKEKTTTAFSVGIELVEYPELTPQQIKKRDRFLRQRQKSIVKDKERRAQKMESVPEITSTTSQILNCDVTSPCSSLALPLALHTIPSPPKVQLGYSSTWSNPTTPETYKKLAGRSNRKLIQNAITHCCLCGGVNKEARTKCFNAMEKSEANHFFVLFREGLKFRSVYEYYPEHNLVTRVYGIGPKNISEKMIIKYLKYDSGAKEFNSLETKHLSIQVDGFVIKKELWEKKQSSSVKHDSMLRKTGTYKK